MSNPTTGPVWLDTVTGEIVTAEPEMGRLVVPAGEEVTSAALRFAGVAGTVTPTEPEPELEAAEVEELEVEELEAAQAVEAEPAAKRARTRKAAASS